MSSSGFEYRIQLFDALDLDDDSVLHEEVDPIFSDRSALVQGGDGQLSAMGQSGVGELDAQRLFVSGFEKAGTELSMDGDGAADNPLGQRISLGIHSEDLEAPSAIKGKTKGLPERCREPVSRGFRP